MKFQRRKAAPSEVQKAYQASVRRHPFLLFGLPFIAMVVAGSFILSPVTAQRYDVDDRKRRFANKQEKFDTTGLKRRKFDATEEYYVSDLASNYCTCVDFFCNRNWQQEIWTIGNRNE
jgi:cytochrome c oxidase assembly protein subunit 16